MPSEDRSVAVDLARHVGRLHALIDPVVVTAAGRSGLSRGEFDVLRTLGAHEGRARPGTIVGALLITTGGVSNILRRLESRGLTGQRRDERDARGVVIELSAAGAELIAACERDVDAAIERLLAPVGREVIRGGASQLHEALLSLDQDAPVHLHLGAAPTTTIAPTTGADETGPPRGPYPSAP